MYLRFPGYYRPDLGDNLVCRMLLGTKEEELVCSSTESWLLEIKGPLSLMALQKI